MRLNNASVAASVPAFGKPAPAWAGPRAWARRWLRKAARARTRSLVASWCLFLSRCNFSSAAVTNIAPVRAPGCVLDAEVGSDVAATEVPAPPLLRTRCPPLLRWTEDALPLVAGGEEALPETSAF